MKTILVLAFITLNLVTIPTSARASDYHRPVSYCRPHLVCTEVIGKCRERRLGYDSCGRCYYYYVTVITYRDVYSDGSTLRYTRTFQG